MSSFFMLSLLTFATGKLTLKYNTCSNFIGIEGMYICFIFNQIRFRDFYFYFKSFITMCFRSTSYCYSFLLDIGETNNKLKVTHTVIHIKTARIKYLKSGLVECYLNCKHISVFISLSTMRWVKLLLQHSYFLIVTFRNQRKFKILPILMSFHINAFS